MNAAIASSSAGAAGAAIPAITATNDFVVKFANVNGSGSASANELFAKAILRMGVPVSPRNIFPSNIQGLPTWYEIRVTGAGYLGRRGGVDLMVAMNPQTWNADVKEIEPGGYLFYDNSKSLPSSKFRNDITVIGVPLTEIANATYSDARQRQLFKNIIYVGVLSVLLDIDAGVFEKLFAEQFKGKEKLLAANMQALQLGREYATKHIGRIGLTVQRADAVGDRIFVDGNTAAALGCVYGGASVCAWYPITPSSSLAEAFQSYCQKLRVDPETGKNRYAIVQAEDEIASIGIIVGAGWNGARAFTTTSGPGVSLMTEFLGLAYFAEIPITLINVQRGGPSTGMPTRTQQSDLTLAAYASHGDTKQVLIFPSTPKECFEMTADAFDLAERLQTPILVMTDLDLGMNDNMSAPLAWDDTRQYDRGKVLNAEQLDEIERFGRYLDVDGDGICYRTIPGTHAEKGAFFTRGTSRDEYARYTEEGEAYVRNVDRLLKKWETAKGYVHAPEFYQTENHSDLGILFIGTTTQSALEAIDLLAADDIHLDAMRVRAFPFNKDVKRFITSHEVVYVVEQNRDAQLRSLLVNELDISPQKLIPILNYDGFPVTAETIRELISKRLPPSAVRRKVDASSNFQSGEHEMVDE